MEPQIIIAPNGEELVVITRARYEELVGDEEAIDLALAAKARVVLDRVAAGQEETFPSAVVEALIEGANPVKVLREHRGMTQQDLAAAAGINTNYLSQIETGRRTGSLDTLRALAGALQVDLDMIVPRALPSAGDAQGKE